MLPDGNPSDSWASCIVSYPPMAARCNQLSHSHTAAAADDDDDDEKDENDDDDDVLPPGWDAGDDQ